MIKNTLLLFKEMWTAVFPKEKQETDTEETEEKPKKPSTREKFNIHANSYLDDTHYVEDEIDLKKYGQNKEE